MALELNLEPSLSLSGHLSFGFATSSPSSFLTNGSVQPVSTAVHTSSLISLTSTSYRLLNVQSYFHPSREFSEWPLIMLTWLHSSWINTDQFLTYQTDQHNTCCPHWLFFYKDSLENELFWGTRGEPLTSPTNRISLFHIRYFLEK